MNRTLCKTFGGEITDGTRLRVVADINRAFREQEEQTPKLVKEFPTLWFNEKGKWAPLQGALDKLRDLRNQIHENFVDETSARRWLDTAEPVWRKIIELSSPLLKYQLVFVESLMDFAESDPDRHKYLVRRLSGEYFVPRAEFVEWKPKLRKQRLFLKAPSEELFLPLYPFLLYEHCQTWESLSRSQPFGFPIAGKTQFCQRTYRISGTRQSA